MEDIKNMENQVVDEWINLEDKKRQRMENDKINFMMEYDRNIFLWPK